VSSDQISYILVALLVTGLATLLLLAGAFIARRGTRAAAAAPAGASAAYPALERSAPVEPAVLRAEAPGSGSVQQPVSLPPVVPDEPEQTLPPAA
jgi:hypothetical protein